MAKSRNKKTAVVNYVSTDPQTIFPELPLLVPEFTITVEKAEEVMQQMQPLPAGPLFPEIEIYEHLPVDPGFIKMLDRLKPTEIQSEKPQIFTSEAEQRQYNARRMREYRRKSTETLEKTKDMLNELKTQCAENTLQLRNMLNSNEVETECKVTAAQFFQIGIADLLLLPGFLQLFQQYWRRREIASESHFEQKSLTYLDKVCTLQKEYYRYKSTRGTSRSPAQLVKKIKDATMKAESYELFMNNKRVINVINDLRSIDINFKHSVGMYLMLMISAHGLENNLLQK